MMLDTHAFLADLAERRPVFHSEADFQHAFAWNLHLRFPQSKIRLERPIQSILGVLHLDLVAELADAVVAFELKYKTRALVTDSAEERFALQDHGAQPPSRYDFVKDLERLESLSGPMPKAIRWAIMLTNDSAYWSEVNRSEGTSAAFSLCEGKTCSGHLDFSSTTSAGTKGKRVPIKLNGSYCFQWREYSSVDAKHYARFRYLAVEVIQATIAA